MEVLIVNAKENTIKKADINIKLIILLLVLYLLIFLNITNLTP